MAAAPKKAGMGAAKAAVSGLIARLSSRIPFLPKRPSSVPEPFSAIEDDTPLGDLLSDANAAPGMAGKAEKRESRGIDLAAAVRSASKNATLVAGVILFLVFLLALAITAIVVTRPPKAPVAAAPFSEKGLALVKKWLPPPGDPLKPRMTMEREGRGTYTSEDAARLGIHPDPAVTAALREKNNAVIEDLYGTVP